MKVTLAVDPGHGPRQMGFEGPLRWTVLGQAHAIDLSQGRTQVRQIATLAGSDGDTAAVGSSG